MNGYQEEYPGDKVQIDVKYVPKKCMSKKNYRKEEKNFINIQQ